MKLILPIQVDCDGCHKWTRISVKRNVASDTRLGVLLQDLSAYSWLMMSRCSLPFCARGAAVFRHDLAGCAFRSSLKLLCRGSLCDWCCTRCSSQSPSTSQVLRELDSRGLVSRHERLSGTLTGSSCAESLLKQWEGRAAILMPMKLRVLMSPVS